MKLSQKVIIRFGCAAILLYILTWLAFLSDGFIPSGSEMHKSDWLQFFGNFLGFLGTTFLGMLTIWQSNEIEKKNDIINYKANVSPNINGDVIFTYDKDKIIEFDHYFEDSLIYTFLSERSLNKGSEAYLQIPFVFSDKIPEFVKIKNLITTWYLGGPHSCAFVPEKEKFVSIVSSGANTFGLPIYMGQDASKYDYFDYIKNLHESLLIEIELQFKTSNIITNSKCVFWIEKKGLDYKVTSGSAVTKSVYIDETVDIK